MTIDIVRKQFVYGSRFQQDSDVAASATQASGRQAIRYVENTGSDFTDSIISGIAWAGSRVTYAFPNSDEDYSYKGEKSHNFHSVGTKIERAAAFILDTSYGSKANDGFAVEGFTKLKIDRASDTAATIRYAESSFKNPTSKAYYPNTLESGGDVWFGTSHNGYSNAVSGNYEFATVIHETGHALGLKHSQEASSGHPSMPGDLDSLENSVMSYYSYVGDDESGYSNEIFGFPQTYMMADVAALQHMYGANFKVNSGNTTYTWKPNSGDTYVNGRIAIYAGSDNIFATIWDGGGRDRYDLSAYHSNLAVDLAAGASSRFSSSQLANLGKYDGNGTHIAAGNIYNALQYEGDTRSLIEDATGGAGNDVIWGNQVANRLVGNDGSDRLGGREGNDRLIGGTGADIFMFKQGWDKDTIQDFGKNDTINLESFHLKDLSAVRSVATDDGDNVALMFGNGDTLVIAHTHKADLHANDFVL